VPDIKPIKSWEVGIVARVQKRLVLESFKAGTLAISD
jgi:hypothetical protein